MKRLLIFFIVAVSGCEYVEIDKCLDNGGKWDYDNDKCLSVGQSAT